MLTKEERARKLQNYGKAYEELTDGLKKFPKEMWEYRGKFDPWTIHEIIVHIADSEANSYVRCRRCIAEPGSSVMGYDENVWVKALDYLDQSPDDAIQLFKWLRGNTYTLIQRLSEEEWSNTMQHSENGLMTMDDWLDIYEAHVRDHLVQMQGIHDEWLGE